MKFEILQNDGNTFETDINFKGNVANIEYGFKAWYGNWCKPDGEPPYRLHNSITPRKVKQIKHIKSGRIFTIGKIEGFVVYTAELVENGKVVASLKFEDYYKD